MYLCMSDRFRDVSVTVWRGLGVCYSSIKMNKQEDETISKWRDELPVHLTYHNANRKEMYNAIVTTKMCSSQTKQSRV